MAPVHNLGLEPSGDDSINIESIKNFAKAGYEAFVRLH